MAVTLYKNIMTGMQRKGKKSTDSGPRLRDGLVPMQVWVTKDHKRRIRMEAARLDVSTSELVRTYAQSLPSGREAPNAS